MADVLEQIRAEKLDHVERCRQRLSPAAMEAAARNAPLPRHFAAHLVDTAARGGYGLIAEIKRASPSRGLIRDDFDPALLAAAYAAGGATCLSVLTDEPFFQGADAHLTAARSAVSLPVLRKDFILDPYQVFESRALGADCMLLIMAAVDDATASNLSALAHDLGMDVLVEVHDAEELERALPLATALIGINNRNLKTLTVDLAVSERLAPLIPGDRLIVGESGLAGPADLARLAAVGIRCFLVGESLMRQPDVEAATRALLAAPAPL
jgi:indole-3-glycerol phosphate synthase